MNLLSLLDLSLDLCLGVPTDKYQSLALIKKHSKLAVCWICVEQKCYALKATVNHFVCGLLKLIVPIVWENE